MTPLPVTQGQGLAILADLPADVARIAEALTARLTEHFPVGTEEAALKARLAAWGFQLDEDDVGQYARYRIDTDAGRDSYFVYWTLDAKRQLTHIEGDVHISCL